MKRDPRRDDDRRQRVLATVDAIPEGCVASYGQVAEEAGLPGRARWVGKVLSTLEAGVDLPWWRVLAADGSIPPRGDGESAGLQRARLESEGISFNPSGRVRMADHRWGG